MQQGVVYAQPQQPVAYVGASGSYPMAEPGQAIQYVNPQGQPVTADGQLIQYVDANGQPMVMEGQEIAGAPMEMAGQFAYAAPEGMEGSQVMYGAPMVAAAPQRINVSPEIFAKLAAGGQLTPQEMEQLNGPQPQQ